MSDWPLPQDVAQNRGVLNPHDPMNPVNGGMRIYGAISWNTATTWTAQRAVYVPVYVQTPITVTHLATEISVAGSANANMGIYEEDGSSVVLGTKVSITGVAGIVSFNITDTLLNPGLYFLAFWCDSANPQVTCCTGAVGMARTCGIQQQTSLASDLPATATFATYATAACPNVYALYKATF